MPQELREKMNKSTCLEIATVLQSMQQAEENLVHESTCCYSRSRVRGAQHSAGSIAGIPLHFDIAAAQCCAQRSEPLLHPCWLRFPFIAGAAA